jgi:hypothetical protein
MQHQVETGNRREECGLDEPGRFSPYFNGANCKYSATPRQNLKLEI